MLMSRVIDTTRLESGRLIDSDGWNGARTDMRRMNFASASHVFESGLGCQRDIFGNRKC